MNGIRIFPEFSTRDGVESRVLIEIEGERRSPITYRFAGELLPNSPASEGWAVLAALPLAMGKNLDLHCAGSVDRGLLANLDEFVQAWSRWRPERNHRIAITAETEFATPPPTGNGAVHALSGGLDSLFSLHAHSTGLLGRRGREIRAAVFLDLDGKKNSPAVLDDLAALAGSYKVPLTSVKTNVRSFSKQWSYSHIVAIASVLHQYAGILSDGIVAADFPYEAEVPGWGNSLVSNALLSGDTFRITTTGAGWSRTEKARVFLGNVAAMERLRVCFEGVGPERNCGRCDKCIRTSLNFIASGAANLPAIGAAPTPSDIRRIVVSSEVTRNFYNELLSAGDWTAHPELRDAVLRIISRGKIGTTLLQATNWIRRSAEKRMSP